MEVHEHQCRETHERQRTVAGEVAKNSVHNDITTKEQSYSQEIRAIPDSQVERVGVGM